MSRRVVQVMKKEDGEINVGFDQERGAAEALVLLEMGAKALRKMIETGVVPLGPPESGIVKVPPGAQIRPIDGGG